MSVDSLLTARSRSRRLRESQRVKVRKQVRGRPRGRPIKHSGIYYTRNVLITDRLMEKIQKNRMPGEPLGSVLERLVGLAERKKVDPQLECYNQQELRPIIPIDPEWDKHFDERRAAERRERNEQYR